MQFLLRLQIEVRIETTQFDAIVSCMKTLVKEFHKPGGITARQAVVNILECTNMIPGIFNLQMLSWRQKLQDILHNPGIVTGFSSLEYPLLLSVEVANGIFTKKSIGTQTTLTDPNGGNILEFKNNRYRLQWVLSEP